MHAPTSRPPLLRLGSQARRRGPAFADQVLGRRDEVVEHVLLLEQRAGLVPFLAVLAAAAQLACANTPPSSSHAMRAG
jgi:hypothetical protein